MHRLIAVTLAYGMMSDAICSNMVQSFRIVYRRIQRHSKMCYWIAWSINGNEWSMFIHPNYFEYRKFILFKVSISAFLICLHGNNRICLHFLIRSFTIELKYYPLILGLSENYTGVKFSAPITCLVCGLFFFPESLLYDSVLIMHAYCMISKAIVWSFWLLFLCIFSTSPADGKISDNYNTAAAWLSKTACPSSGSLLGPSPYIPVSHTLILNTILKNDQSTKRGRGTSSTFIWDFFFIWVTNADSQIPPCFIWEGMGKELILSFHPYILLFQDYIIYSNISWAF